MSKASPSLSGLPPEVSQALAELGQHLALARLRRNESQRSWAQRIGVSVPTLASMERGEPGVSMGVYATALWMMGRTKALAALAEPQFDFGALEADVRAAAALRQQRAGRRRASKPRSDER
ncbi:helix-turn-helix domain-containing protein [Caldimonas sp. KR1-144]|uniref:helix-turn-helix domain-containing protein n=1 Tax=Caldimonas sp. KR1-144 TaxID=3400911 RepID=UPI003C060ED5